MVTPIFNASDANELHDLYLSKLGHIYANNARTKSINGSVETYIRSQQVDKQICHTTNLTNLQTNKPSNQPINLLNN